jgi:hypothetical protein
LSLELVSSSTISLQRRSSMVGASLIVHFASKGSLVTRYCHDSRYFCITIFGLGRMTLSVSQYAISWMFEINFLNPSIVSETVFLSSSAQRKMNLELRYLALPLVWMNDFTLSTSLILTTRLHVDTSKPSSMTEVAIRIFILSFLKSSMFFIRL